MLRQRSRRYLFLYTVAPSIDAAGLKSFDFLSSSTELRDELEQITLYFREKMSSVCLDIKVFYHSIDSFMLYDTNLVQKMVAGLSNDVSNGTGIFLALVI